MELQLETPNQNTKIMFLECCMICYKKRLSLRKACNERDQTLKDEDDAIEVGLRTDPILQPVLTPIYAPNLICFF